ncbi:phosphatidylinositol transfer protein Sfh5p [Monosporozyma unispora]|nr:Non-classical phosphatidylinositol transfer protein (PITP) [Kazachstania unispora]
MVPFNNDTEKKVFNNIKKQLPSIIHDKCQDYDEFYGHKLIPGGNGEQFYNEDIADHLIYKLCKAYQFNETETKTKTIHILNWRREFNPLSAGFMEQHDEMFEKIGILTEDRDNEPNKKVITWNLYGQIEDRTKMFANGQDKKFIRYRIGLMERGINLLDFHDDNNCYMTQIHDYKNVSMIFGMNAEMKACIKNIVTIFQDYYPESLYAKYFVNVPTVLAWIYDLLTKFVDKHTRDKFVVLSSGSKLGKYIKNSPAVGYGGKSKQSLKEQNKTDIRPTEYGLFLLQQQSNEEVE